MQDFRYALRRLSSRPAFAGLIILMLALGIGANTAVFTIVDQTILRPPPFADADRLVDVLWWDRARNGGGSGLVSAALIGWQSQPDVFDRLEALAPQTFDVTGDGEPERIRGQAVSVGLFPMLGVSPRLGRAFSADDDKTGSERVVILSDGFWRRRYGADAAAIGRLLTLSDQPHRIVGIMPRNFSMSAGSGESVWVPLDIRNAGAGAGMTGLGRLTPAATVESLQTRADTIADRLQAATPLPGTWGLRLMPHTVAYVDDVARRSLLILLGAVGLVLLIVCANVAHLFLMQASGRGREMALRSALGATRARLVREVLTESTLLSVTGGAGGLLVALWGLDAAVAAAPGSMSFLNSPTIRMDGRVLLFNAVVTIATGMLFGLVPAIRGSRPNPHTTLHAMTHGRLSGAHGHLPSFLVAAQVALALTLLTGAALMTRTFVKLNTLEPGFDPAGLMTARVALPTDRYPTASIRGAFFDQLIADLKQSPGVSGAAIATGALPGDGGFSWGIEAEDSPRSKESGFVIGLSSVGLDYFRTLRIPIIEGQTFTERDTNTAVVSRSFARDFWPDGSVVGRRIRNGSNSPWLTITGVVGDVQKRIAGDLNTRVLYQPLITPPATVPAPPRPARRTYVSRTVVVRGDDPSQSLQTIKARIWAIDKAQPIEDIAAARELYGDQFDRQRFVLLLMGTFAGIAMLLAGAGIFAVHSQAVAQRTREIGLRVALGASPSDILRMVLKRGMLPTILGAVLGLAAAASTSRVLTSLLYEVNPHDPSSYAAVTLALLGVAMTACLLPARRALKVDPAVALRVE